MNTADKKVSLEIPLNTQMKIFAFLFEENYSMSELFPGTREIEDDVGYYGESQTFEIGTQTNNLSLSITLIQVPGTGTDTGGETDTTDTTAPTVSSVYPADNQNEISITENISVTFSKAMNTTSVTTNMSNTTCSGSFQLSSNNFSSCIQMSSSPSSSNSFRTFTVDPSNNLSNYTNYKIRVTTGVKDTAGNSLSSQYVTSSGFTTESSPDTTLLAHYAFEGNLNDNSSYNRKLNEVGSNITYSAADNQSNKSGQAALFNGTDTYAYTDNISISSTDNFTIAFWVRPDSPNMSQWDSVMSTGNSTSGGRFQIDYSGNHNIRFVVSGATLSMALDNNTWNHFVYTKTYTSTSNKLQFYKNGSSQGSSAPVVTRWDKLKIGLNRNGGGYWKGYIDELKIYNRAFTGTEVSTLFEGY